MKKGESDEKTRKNDKEEIAEILDRLPPEYVRKIKIYAGTLEEIFLANFRAVQ